MHATLTSFKPTMSPTTTTLLFLLLLLTTLLSTTVSEARVPADQTFRSLNDGEFGEYPAEFNADYRFTGAPGSHSGLFNLMWYNNTPGRFYVGIRMGLPRSESPFRWVWDANRGHPVGDNATLTFSSDGNLVLAEADGRVVWSTGTANKGVVGMRTLDNGNMVLYNKKGNYVWQSFDHPTDTLLVGQSLYPTGPTKLVSRRSPTDNSDGIYSFALERRELNLYLTTPTKRYLYANLYRPSSDGDITIATFDTRVYNDAYNMIISTNLAGTEYLSEVYFNATMSILRLEADGSLVVYSYYDPMGSRLWKKTYDFFDGGEYNRLLPCALPSKCGALGLCEDAMCVGCPTAKGTMGWSKGCGAPARAGACGKGSGGYYYKVVGVEQFIAVWNGGDGLKVKVEECKRRCSLDCECKGVFYWEESGTCWLAPLLGTLSKVDNTSHVAYVKYSN